MPQSVLDPRQTVASGTAWSPQEPIPVRVRSFGLFPNVDDWLPGDLLLVSPIHPDWIDRQICQAQERSGYAPEDALWLHAAAYMGDGYLCEAGTSGVRYVPVSNYVGEHMIRLRRDPSLTDPERWRLAIQAVVRLGEPYDFLEILSVFKHSLSTSWTAAFRSQFSRNRRSVICSQLYADAFMTVTGRLLSTNAHAAITPATLSLSTRLQDVPLHWKQIV